MSHEFISGTEGLRRIAMDYLDAMSELRGKPKTRLVADAIRAGRNFEIGTKVVHEEEDMFRELFMRITPYEKSGRALKTQA